MTPTIAEVIFWVILGIPCAVLLLAIICGQSDTIDITPGKRRDWEREERKWK